jgi:hypothetical protein
VSLSIKWTKEIRFLGVFFFSLLKFIYIHMKFCYVILLLLGGLCRRSALVRRRHALHPVHRDGRNDPHLELSARVELADRLVPAVISQGQKKLQKKSYKVTKKKTFTNWCWVRKALMKG